PLPPPSNYTLSLHDSLPISPVASERPRRDLHTDRALAALVLVGVHHADDTAHGLRIEAQSDDVGDALVLLDVGLQDGVEQRIGRSEEHTSELQSRFDLVCRL